MTCGSVKSTNYSVEQKVVHFFTQEYFQVKLVEIETLDQDINPVYETKAPNQRIIFHVLCHRKSGTIDSKSSVKSPV